MTKFKGYSIEKLSAASCIFEGSEESVSEQIDFVSKIAKKHHGLIIDDSVEKGYNLTLCIAYLRDEGLKVGYFGESLETTVNWSSIDLLMYEMTEGL